MFKRDVENLDVSMCEDESKLNTAKGLITALYVLAYIGIALTLYLSISNKDTITSISTVFILLAVLVSHFIISKMINGIIGNLERDRVIIDFIKQIGGINVVAERLEESTKKEIAATEKRIKELEERIANPGKDDNIYVLREQLKLLKK